MVGNGKNDDLLAAFDVNHAVGEAPDLYAAGAEPMWTARLRMRGDQLGGVFDLGCELVSEPGDLLVVAIYRFAQLSASRPMEANGPPGHRRARARNSAKTWSAGINSAVPASTSASLREISSSHARSTSAGSSMTSSSRLTIKRWASCARSRTDNSSASASSCFKGSFIVPLSGCGPCHNLTSHGRFARSPTRARRWKVRDRAGAARRLSIRRGQPHRVHFHTIFVARRPHACVRARSLVDTSQPPGTLWPAPTWTLDPRDDQRWLRSLRLRATPPGAISVRP